MFADFIATPRAERLTIPIDKNILLFDFGSKYYGDEASSSGLACSLRTKPEF